jgi:hypothetical protein
MFDPRLRHALAALRESCRSLKTAQGREDSLAVAALAIVSSRPTADLRTCDLVASKRTFTVCSILRKKDWTPTYESCRPETVW